MTIENREKNTERKFPGLQYIGTYCAPLLADLFFSFSDGVEVILKVYNTKNTEGLIFL